MKKVKVSELIEVILVVTPEQKKLKASLTFTNLWSYPLDLVKFITLPDGKADNNYFQLFDVAERELPYQGIMKKRARPDDDDFYWLEPGQFVHGWLYLNDYYPIPRKGGVQLVYGCQNHFAIHDEYLLSNLVTISTSVPRG